MTANDKHAGAVLTIDLDAIRDNYRLLRAKVGRAACAAAVKADAYGLGGAPRCAGTGGRGLPPLLRRASR